MKHKSSTPQSDMSAQLERLVCGELDESDRRAVVAWLDEDPRRWRLCGVLFLEAQNWSQALAEWPTQGESARPIAVSATADIRGGQSRPRRVRDVAVLAASLLLAFLLGATTRHVGDANRGDFELAVTDRVPTAGAASLGHVGENGDDDTPVMAMLPIASQRGIPLQPAVHIAVVPSSASKSNRGTSTDARSIPDYVRQQWARRGYDLDIERRYLFATLPGGEQVAVPFEQYAIKPLPPKIN